MGAHVNLLNSFYGEIRFHTYTHLTYNVHAHGGFNYSLTDARVCPPVPPPPQIELPYAFNLPTEIQNNLCACNAIMQQTNQPCSSGGIHHGYNVFTASLGRWMTVVGDAEGKVIGIVLCPNDMANNRNVIRVRVYAIFIVYVFIGGVYVYSVQPNRYDNMCT